MWRPLVEVEGTSHQHSQEEFSLNDVVVFFQVFFSSSLPAGPVRVREDVNDDDDDEEEGVKVSGCGRSSSGLSQLYLSSVKRRSYT